MTILTGFMTFVEKNIILLATQKEASGLVSQNFFFKYIKIVESM